MHTQTAESGERSSAPHKFCRYLVFLIKRARGMFAVGLFLLLVPLASAYYCDGRWVDRSSMFDSFMNYSLNGARTEFNYSDPAGSLQQFLQEACPAQVVRFGCYWHSDDPVRSRKQEEIHFLPFNRTSCKPFSPNSFLKKIRNRRVVFMGDSVMDQLWYSLVCSMHKAEENFLHIQNVIFKMWECKRERCPVAPNPDESKPHPQQKETQSGFINFRRSNVSVSFLRQYKMTPHLSANVRKQGLSSDDVLIITFGLHYYFEELYRREMESMASWIESLVDPPHILILHVPPQHFKEPNGYFDYRHDNSHYRNCFPLPNWNESSTRKQLPPHDWRNAVLEDVFMPLVKQKKAFIVPISMGLNGRHDAHVGWGDCTHWCFPSTIFKYVHMMILNALDHVLSRKQLKTTAHHVFAKDNWWKSNPALRDGMLVQFDGERSIYLVEKGVLREFQSWNAFVSRGFDLSNVFHFAREELGPIELGKGVF